LKCGSVLPWPVLRRWRNPDASRSPLPNLSYASCEQQDVVQFLRVSIILIC
jgi:hypothetical protein